jgi:hypothetical protein
MVAKLRVLSALCALVAAVIVVWQTNPAGPGTPGSVELRSTAAPLSDVSTTIKWPVIETVNPRPFDPCGGTSNSRAWPTGRREYRWVR